MENEILNDTINNNTIKNDVMNIKIMCPFCKVNVDRLVKGNKKFKCLDCFKSFKKPLIINIGSDNINNIKTFTNSTIEKDAEFKDVAIDPELNKTLDTLSNNVTPPITLTQENPITCEAVLTNSNEIDNVEIDNVEKEIDNIKKENKPKIKRIVRR